MNQVKTMALLALGVCGFVSGCGVSAKSYFEVGPAAMRGEYDKVIELLEPDFKASKTMDTGDLYLLCDAYYKTRRYKMLDEATAKFEQRVAQGQPEAFLLETYGISYDAYAAVFRARWYLDLGKPAEALATAESALKQLDAPGELQNPQRPIQRIFLLEVKGISEVAIGRGDLAARTFRELQGMELGFPVSSVLVDDHQSAMARVALAMEAYPDALKVLQADRTESQMFKAFAAGVATMVAGNISWDYQEMPRQFCLGKSLYETGNLDQAKRVYDGLLKNPRTSQYDGIYWVILADRGTIDWRQGNLPTAREKLYKAIQIVEDNRSSIASDSSRIGFVGDKQKVYQELVGLLVEMKRPDEAFEVAERGRSRALVDLLAGQKQWRPEANSEAGQTLAALDKAELEDLTITTKSQGDSERQTRGVVVGLREKLRTKAPELASLVTVQPTQLKEIQALLNPTQTMVEYYKTIDGWVAFVVTADQIRVVRLPRADMETLSREFHQACAKLGDLARLQHKGNLLWQILIKPIEPHIAGTSLLLIPQGVLHYIPFAALYDGSEYLVKQYSLRNVPSASVLPFLQRTRAEGDSLVLGDPDLGKAELRLKYAQTEAQSIAKILPRSTLRLGRQASETFLRSQGKNASTIHIAAHGMFHPDDPLQSAIFLAPDSSNDGRLMVGDLYNLRLDADLVTLSGCETARGKVASGDDVVGFTRGLFYAGTRSVLSSLWKVDDQATGELMTRFYTSLATQTRPRALQTAQLQTMDQYPHPYFWAAWVLAGQEK